MSFRYTICAAASAAVAAMALTGTIAQAQDKAVELHGAVQFDDNHAFNKALIKFEDLTRSCYKKPIKFVLHRNSELGLEKEYFNFMSKGVSVDYAIVSPSHMSTYSKKAPLMDMPFLFRDLTHWNKVLDQDGLAPIAKDVEKRADVKLIGYAGGGTRNLIVNKPVTSMSDLKGLPMRVMGAPIQTRIFEAISAAPSVIAYSEVYNAIQTGVIDAAENEAAGIEQMKFYEVGPHISATQHAITVRPIGFSGKTFRKLPKELQACIVSAGKEAGAYGRQIESSQDAEKLAKMEKDGKLKVHAFKDRATLLKLSQPVKEAYAKELGATDVLMKITNIKYKRRRVTRRASLARRAATTITKEQGRSEGRELKARRNWLDWLDRALRVLMTVLFAILIVPVTMQIVARYTNWVPRYIWTEEIARFCFIWIIMLGAMIAVRDDTHFSVDVLPEPKTTRGKGWAGLIPHLAMLALSLCFIYYGKEFSEQGLMQTSEIADLPMIAIYAAWPLAGVVWTLFLIEKLSRDIRRIRGIDTKSGESDGTG